MYYKRPINGVKKYTPRFCDPNPSYPAAPAGIFAHHDKEFLGIPLPNEKEVFPEHSPERKAAASFASPLAAVVRYIRKHVKIEELILLGLIVLMLDESIEDDLLLIILIYILLF